MSKQVQVVAWCDEDRHPPFTVRAVVEDREVDTPDGPYLMDLCEPGVAALEALEEQVAEARRAVGAFALMGSPAKKGRKAPTPEALGSAAPRRRNVTVDQKLPCVDCRPGDAKFGITYRNQSGLTMHRYAYHPDKYKRPTAGSAPVEAPVEANA